jgi:diacylglycerol kinase family enzyme
MGWARFTRRAGLRAGLAGLVAAPFGRRAALTAAVVGAAQEQPGAGLALGALGAAARRTRRARRARPERPARLSPAVQVAVGATVALATRAVWPVAPKRPAEVAPHRTWSGLDPSPDGAGIGLVVNLGAGSGGSASPSPRPGAGVADMLRAELPEATIVVLDDPSALEDELERIARSEAPSGSRLRALGIAGGDGSINTAAAVALRHGLPLVVVPAGTLNHLARDLGVETVGDAVEAVRRGTALEIDVARIAGRPFLNTASVGSYVEIVDAREELEGRIGKWPALLVALARVLRRGEPVVVELDGRRQRLWAVFVGNCRYQPDGMAPTWRERLDDGQLDVRVADAAHPFGRTRLVLAVATGRLHRSRVFRTWRTTGVRVRSADGPLRLARDGETFDGTEDFDIVKSGDRLAVYAPRPAQPGQTRR